MKTLLFAFAALFLVVIPSRADDTAQEKTYRDYLESAIEPKINAAPDLWEGVGAGGYLFCFEFDLNNDGNQELFVTSSLKTHGLNAEWTVFHKTASGAYVPYGNTVMLPLTGFAVAQDGGATTFVNCSSRGYKYYASYQMVVGNTFNAVSKEISEKEYDRLNAPGGVKQVIPRMKAIHLVDFLRDPKQPWVDVDPTTLEGNGDGFVRIPGDAQRIKGFTLTPQAALEEIRRMKQ